MSSSICLYCYYRLICLSISTRSFYRFTDSLICLCVLTSVDVGPVPTFYAAVRPPSYTHSPTCCCDKLQCWLYDVQVLLASAAFSVPLVVKDLRDLPDLPVSRDRRVWSDSQAWTEWKASVAYLDRLDSRVCCAVTVITDRCCCGERYFFYRNTFLTFPNFFF